MTTAAKFPAALVTLANLGGEFPNFPEAVLSGAHNNSVTTITLTATVNAAWPTTGGWVTIDSEIIQYTGVSGATLTSCTRASQGTSAASHSDQAKVGLYLTAATVNQMNAETIALETAFGAFADNLGRTDRWTYSYSGEYAPTNSSATGTGAISAAASVPYRLLSTGATSASTVQIRSAYRATAVTGAVGKLRRLEIQVRTEQIDANTTWYVMATSEGAVTEPSVTADHIGVREAGATIFFSTADGTTNQTTDITSAFTAAQEAMVVIVFDGTTARCFVDGTLKATHATNVPRSNVSQVVNMRWFIKNSAAADKQMYACHFIATHLT